ncbi:MAG: FtsX-like permease family protein [Saprospiraceae bacterium]|nr:FtsX-like permease family protein [Saprospiraceae bacterium]
MMIRIAWKNIWRNRLRSLVIILSTTIGVWSLIFLLSWVFGIIDGYISKAVDYRLSHIQVHHPKFQEDGEIKYYFQKGDLSEGLRDTIVGRTDRMVVSAMIQSPRSTRGLLLYGVDPIDERSVTRLDELIKEGTFLNAETRNPIVISTSIAEKLKVSLRSKVVANFQDRQGNITAGAFRIVGLFDSGDIKLDDFTAYIQKSDLAKLTGLPEEAAHEVAFRIIDLDAIPSVKEEIKEAWPDLVVEDYKELSPDIELFSSQIQMNVIIMTIIFMLALIFGIINSMLMAVLERVKELGMLMAIGMNKIRVFSMIVLETVMLSMIGVPLGLGIGYITVYWMNQTGINLSNWSEGLRQFGMSQMVYPDLDPYYYGFVATAVAITSILASIYPSLKAIRLKPVEALRKI